MPAPVNRRSAYASTVSTGLNVLDLSGQYTRQATEVPRTDQRHHGFEENELAEAVLVSLDQPLRQVGTQRPQVGAPLLGMKRVRHDPDTTSILEAGKDVLDVIPRRSARGLDHQLPAVTLLVTDIAGHQFCLGNRTAHRSATEHETSLLGALLRAQGSANTVTVDEVGPPTTVLVPQHHGHIRATRHFSCAQPS